LAVADALLDDPDYGTATPMHHFVFYTKQRDGGGGTTTKTNTDLTNKALAQIAAHQEQRCGICHADDIHTLRIPVFCSAGDKDEYDIFKGLHNLSLKHDESCITPLHVGCAQWAGNALSCRG
jgi:hypothetical protein